MTDKKKQWIQDVEGVFAQVEAGARDLWTKVRGWAEADEPGPTDQVWVVNENPEIGPGRLPYAAVELHAGLGWAAGAPPEPAGTTKDPAPVEQATPTGPAKTKTTAAGGDKNKEL
jgi:hypothetical protein